MYWNNLFLCAIIQLLKYLIIRLFGDSIIKLFNCSIILLFNYSITEFFNYSIILFLIISWFYNLFIQLVNFLIIELFNYWRKTPQVRVCRKECFLALIYFNDSNFLNKFLRIPFKIRHFMSFPLLVLLSINEDVVPA